MLSKAAALWQQIRILLFGLVGSVALLNGIVAIMAFIKDVLMASYLGTSMQADALTLAYFIPDTLGTNLIGMALGVAAVPVFSRLHAHGDYELLWSVVRRILIWVFIASCFLVGIIYLFSSELIGVLVDQSELNAATLPLLHIILPLIVFAPVVYIGFAVLQTESRFMLPAGSAAILHGLIIIVLVCCMVVKIPIVAAGYGIAGAITVGMLVLVFITWKAIVNQTEFIFRGKKSTTQLKELRKIWRVFLLYFIILCSTQAVYLVERMLAARFDSGTVAALNYAFRLSQLPIWIFVAAVTAVILPSLSKDIAMERRGQLTKTVSSFIQNICIVSIPTMLLLYVLHEPIVAVLLKHGAFNEHSVRITSSLLKGYSLTILGLSISAVCTRYYLAASQISKPLIVYLVSAILNIVLDYVFIDYYGAVGLGYGAAIAASLNGGMLLIMLAIRLKLPAIKSLLPLVKIIVANILPLLVIILAAQMWGRVAANDSFVLHAGFLAIVLAIWLIVYWIALRKLDLIQLPDKE